MRKIALRGLMGRKRDTLLLWSVVALAFLFLVLSTTIITSLEATDARQRVDTYGSWQVMASGVPEETGRALAETAESAALSPLVWVSGDDYFGGDNEYTLGFYSPELAELGSLRLREGDWPRESNEIVLEYARMAALGLEVGDTLSLSCTQELTLTKECAAANEAALAAHIEANKAVDRETAMNFFLHGNWQVDEEDQLWVNGRQVTSDPYYLGLSSPETGVLCWWLTDGEVYSPVLLPEALEPGEDAVPLSRMSEEQFAVILEQYLGFWNWKYAKEVKLPCTMPADLLGLGDMSVRVSGDAVRYMRKYTVCGVVETYSDRWDSGEAELPAGFITAEACRLYGAAQELVLEKYPYFAPAEFDYLVLLGGEGSARDLYQANLPVYDSALRLRKAVSFPVLERRAAEAVPVEKAGYTYYEYPQGTTFQVTFDLLLADPDRPLREEARSVKAWLVPEWLGEGMEDYCAERLLTEEDGQLAESTAGDASDLLERGGYFTVTNFYEGVQTGSFALEIDQDKSRVALELDGARYEVPLEDFRTGNFTVNGLVPMVQEGSAWLEDMDQQTEYTAYRLNSFGYPASAEGGGSLLALVMGILFVTTVCAVFQICFTQVRRRLRRIVLLKSVGAETGQVAAMMGWEFLYFWAAALPAGTLLGLGAAWAATAVLAGVQGRTVLLHIQPGVLLLALLAGTLALAAGMAVPMVMAVGVPLTGRTARKKPLPPPKKETRQDFFHVTLRGLAANKGRTAGSFALCAFMMTIAVLCLFLGFRLMGDYRDTVERDGQPDYLLRSPYAMSERQRETYLEELEALGVCGGIRSYFLGEDIILDRSSWGDSPLLPVAAGDTEGAQAEGYAVDLITLSPEDPLFAEYRAAVTQGSLDPERFAAHRDGKSWNWEVLVMVPLYREGGRVDEEALEKAQGWYRLVPAGIDTSYYAEYDGVYARDTALRAGDVITLRTETSTPKEGYYETSTHSVDVTVGAILYYFPDTGIWPVSGSGEGYQIVADTSLLPYLLPNAGYTRNLNEVRSIRVQQRSLDRVDNEYGATEFLIDAREDVDLEEADTALLIYSREKRMDLTVYHESSRKLLRDAVNNILLCCLLGLTAVLLALVIFFNTVTSDIEQERRRIGILQALGVSDRQLLLRQLCLGLAASGGAVLIANALLWGGVAGYALCAGKVLGNLLWGYPVLWHIVLCLALGGVITLLYLLPVLRLRKYLPVDNIRTGK